MSRVLALLLLLCTVLTGCEGLLRPEDHIYYAGLEDAAPAENPAVPAGDAGMPEYMGTELPAWDGESAWTEINNNEPWFTDADRERVDAFEEYSELDELGRCGQAYANICLELMPTEARGEIGSVRPSGWHTIRYNDLVEGNYLYNRCHLIGFQLAGENANPKNLITGTRYLNIQGMLDIENAVAEQAKNGGGHVLYRVTPVFAGDELVCRGLVIEAYSVEDGGESIRTCRFSWNAQPGIIIDYATGESRRADGRDQADVEYEEMYGEKHDYVVNMSSGKIHEPDCRYAADISEANRLDIYESLAKLHESGYTDCGTCRPGE